MERSEIPVLLLTGYLGSGKTTLLNRILNNRKGIRFAVIVNDIGEVNIDADLIQRGGIVGSKDDSLVALQNGCICCTLKMDMVEQLSDIAQMKKFDYIVIEASGICEPTPIAQTIYSIPTLGPSYMLDCLPRLDCICTVVDALRLKDEFKCGGDLLRANLEAEDIENLVINQIEFCNIVLLNKASMVERSELNRIREIIKALQPKAEIIECDYCDVELDKIVGTGMFDFDDVATSATWIKAVEGFVDEEEEHHHDLHHHDDDEVCEHCGEHHHGHDCDHHHHDDDEVCEHYGEHHHGHDCDHHHHEGEVCEECGEHHHGHHHCCCHHHDGAHGDEYGISTYVYTSRKPMDIGLFDHFVARNWPKGVIRAKGLCYFQSEPQFCYLFEQAGKQVSMSNAGQWFAEMPKEELEPLLMTDATLRRDWDEKYGDRQQKLVFIGQHLDKAAIKNALDDCLVDLL